MVKPIGVVNSITNKSVKVPNSLISKAEAKVRIENLIKEFEEIYKSTPSNNALAKHIQNLKESLKLYQ